MTGLKTLIFNKLTQTKADNRDAVLALPGVFFLSLGAILIACWTWTTGQPVAALWVGLTLWLTALVAGVSFLLLVLGRQS